MKRSTLRRAASALAVSALAFTGVAVTAAAPAQAAPQECSTRTVVTAMAPTQAYGAYNTIRVDTTPTCPDGDNFIAAGTIYLQRSVNGGPFTNVKAESGTDASLMYYSGYGIAPANSLFRAVFVGGSAGENTWTGNTSAAVRVLVTRTFKFSQRSVRGGVKGTFKIKPKASSKGLRVKFQVKKGKWRKYKTVRANKKGVVTLVFKASRKGIPYRMIMPGSRGFAKETIVLGKARTRYYRAVVR